MQNRREFLKIAGLSGLGLACTRVLPEFPDVEEPEVEEPEVEEPDPTTLGWLQNANMITSSPWYLSANSNKINSIWRGYDIKLKDTPKVRKVRISSADGFRETAEKELFVINGTFDGAEIKGVPLISHVPVSETAFEQAHAQGFRVIPYVHFTDIHTYYADQDIYMYQHPEILLKDKDDRWVHPISEDDSLQRFVICPNSPKYLELSLAYIKKLMDWGADGLFIDDVTANQKECFADTEKEISTYEFEQPYTHKHINPNASAKDAFSHFLESVRKKVKEYGDDKVIILNEGYKVKEYAEHADCCRWESWIYSEEWVGRNPDHSWTKIKAKAKDLKWYLESDGRIAVSSKLDVSRKEVKDDAYWAFCSARLLDFIWWSSLKGTGSEELYRVHMGKGLQPLQEADQVAYRTFQKGVIVLNDSSQDITKSLDLPDSFNHKQLFDLYENKKPMQIIKGQISVVVPQKSARIYVVS